MTGRTKCRFSVKWLFQIVCVCSVIVSANNSTQNDQVKTNSYTASMVSTTTVPVPAMLESTTLGQLSNDQRTIQSMMMGMVDGKEKIWSYKKKGLMGTHNLDVKLPAQESFFCKLIKKQSVVMFSFCEDGDGWGGGWKKKADGWSSDDKKGKKKKGKKKKKKGGGGGGKKKKGGGGGKKKKGGGKKKKGGGKKKKGKGKKKGGSEDTGGWGQKKEPQKKGWKPPEKKKGWKPPPKKKGWKPPPPPKGWSQDQPPVKTEPKGWGSSGVTDKATSKGWGQDQQRAQPPQEWDEREKGGGWGGEEEDEEEESDWQAEDSKKGENDDDFGGTSQDDDYKPKKNYKGKVKPPGKIQSAVTVSTSYLSEFDLNKWVSSDTVKNNSEDILNHHFYRATRQA